MNAGISQKIETLNLYFQGGVRRSVLVVCIILVILSVPSYFIGQLTSALWANTDLNPGKLDRRIFVKDKIVTQQEYSIDRSSIVPLANGEVVLYSTVNNRNNPYIGYNPFVYRIQILDNQGTVLDEKIEESYLLPGEFKYVLATTKNSSATRLVITPLPQTKAVLFNPFKLNLANKFNVEIRNPVVRNLDNSQELEVLAFVKNQELIEIRNLDLLYIIRDDRDRVVGIGKYRVDFLKSGEEKEFILRYPKPKYRTATRLDLRSFVNYLEPNNVRLAEIIEPKQPR